MGQGKGMGGWGKRSRTVPVHPLELQYDFQLTACRIKDDIF